ncbi:MAG: prolyl oligopeptidase family serine peptidase [Spirochaetes bacterium]|nr:prolyl oligopeptidase family serine peptidase [Spirochaetota bacterium]
MKEEKRNLLGSYGSWLKGYMEGKQMLSPLSWKMGKKLSSSRAGIKEWKEKARSKFKELIGYLPLKENIQAKVLGKRHYEGLIIEEIAWQMPFGPETRAYFLKPEKSAGALPGVLALHDHGGFKYFGKEKITRIGERVVPVIKEHWKKYYSGRALANEIAKQGYGVLVPDVFTFGSRKIKTGDLPDNALIKYLDDPGLIRELKMEEKSSITTAPPFSVDLKDVSEKQIDFYNRFAKQYEHIIAKSLFSAGTTWPALVVADDQAALSYLCSRRDIDESRIGCCGLSGGGLRTNYLAGLDDRIKCSVTAGFMSTWRDFALNVSYAHTWMLYIPHISRYFDFPEIIGMRVPLPSMVLSTLSDPLYSAEETERAGEILSGVYKKADALDRLKISRYEGPHYFNISMQKEAFAWLDHWLKG